MNKIVSFYLFIAISCNDLVDSFSVVRTTRATGVPRTLESNTLSISSGSSSLHSTTTKSESLHTSLNDVEAETAHGMPWDVSIAGPDAPLLYMPFWEWQLEFMKENLTNLRLVECSSNGSVSFPTSTSDFSYEENKDKKARIVNLCYTSDEYRKIRMTYYDAGVGCQVYNSVWYPHEDHNLPVLGSDILSFGGRKFLAIVDFQPLYEDEEDHSVTFEQPILAPIKQSYPSLSGKMSSKFYDETQFFSQQMLFSRFEKKDIITDELFPAFKDYVKAHVDLVKNTNRIPSSDIEQINQVGERQAAYDTYSAERDPATGLFASMFGKEWADEFVHGFLFSRSEMSESEASSQQAPTGGQPSHGVNPLASGPPPNMGQKKVTEVEKAPQVVRR